ncbi:hypothetical protein Pelo_7386 [Pelomyxa schiedti]|nr:hypothetical protein Pelo_7386 [Pelomyxa schiedti]
MSSASSSSSPTASAATTTTTYLSTRDLAANLGRGSWVVLDVRWIHGDPLKGRADFLESHIEGAVFVHLVEDATGEVVPGVTGRNPLPSLEKANKGVAVDPPHVQHHPRPTPQVGREVPSAQVRGRGGCC